MMSVLVRGLSMPLSMMVVATSTSTRPAERSSITRSSSSLDICPCATPTRASGAASLTRRTASSMVFTRLLT